MIGIGSVLNCCSAKLIYGFGGTITAMHGPRGHHHKGDLKRGIKEAISTIRRNGNGLVVAYTNQQQTVANQVLQELGFHNTGKVSKRKHSDTKLIMWWLPLGEVEAIPEIEVKAGPARDARGRFMKKEVS